MNRSYSYNTISNIKKYRKNFEKSYNRLVIIKAIVKLNGLPTVTIIIYD